MGLKDRFASALAVRAGITIVQAEKAIDEVVSLIKTKVPPHIGKALEDLVDSENGVSHAVFLISGAPVDQQQAIGKAEVAPILIPASNPQPTGSPAVTQKKMNFFQRFLAYWGSGK